MSIFQEIVEWFREHKITVGLAMLGNPGAIVGPISDVLLSKNKKKLSKSASTPPVPPPSNLEKKDEYQLNKLTSM